jgi:hypothetical protein
MGTRLALMLVAMAAGAAAQEWREVEAEYKATFTPLPVRRMFSDLDAELKLGRQDPFSRQARTEIQKARMALKLRREQIREARRARSAVVDRIASFGDRKAAVLLVKAYERVRADIDLAIGNLDRHLDAAATDINPGVDPGGIYWKNWVRLTEMGGAKGVLGDERKVRDDLLARFRVFRGPGLREWLVKHAGTDKRLDVRVELVRTMAAGTDPEYVPALVKLYYEARETWVRTLIVDALGAGQTRGALGIVFDALKDDAWPVRAAAIHAMRSYGRHDGDSIEALLAALEVADGRLRWELRDALCAATGQAHGLGPVAWRSWWDGAKADWEPQLEETKVAPLATESLPSFFGIPTTSKRIAFCISRSQLMAEPVHRRRLDNAGRPSPAPQVDTGYNIGVWELGQTRASLPTDAEFTVIVFGNEVECWSKALKKAHRSNCASALRFCAKYEPHGTSALNAAIETALRIGQPHKLQDLDYGNEGGVDTIFILCPVHFGGRGMLGRRDGLEPEVRRVARLRRVVIHTVIIGNPITHTAPSSIAAVTGGRTVRPR